MKQRVIDNIRREHPWTFGLDLKLKSKVLKERNRLMKELLSQYFDKLLTHLLRKTMFMRIYWTLIPSLKKKLTHEELVATLEDIQVNDTGIFIFGDVAYLKLANDLGRAVGDKMLKRVAKYVAAAGFYIYGRFSQGDEVIAYHHSAEDGLRAIAKISELLSSHELVTDLPMAIDFGRATHHEVAATYLRLLHEGWRPKAGRSPKKVFFDIALKIAETRSEIRKVYDRAYLLYLYYESVHDQNSDRTHLHYKAFKRQVTRGKLVEPTRSWLTMSKAKREGLMLEKSLALVSQLPPDADLFDRVVVEVAKSIFLAKH